MTAPGRVHHLDVRHLPPPEPMERVLELLPELRPGDLIRMYHRREPFPLYGLLADAGFRHRILTPEHCPFEIRIWPAAGPEPDPDDAER
mgnify:CR=1 FL=1